MAELENLTGKMEKLEIDENNKEKTETYEEKDEFQDAVEPDEDSINDSDSEVDGENGNIEDVEEVILTEGQLKERKAIVNELKEKGNDFFRLGDGREASKLYTQALKECPSQLTSERSILYNNRAAAKVKMQRKESAVKDCTKAIELNPTYIKALLRRAKLYEELDQLDKALSDYKELHKLDPKNPDVNFAINTLPKRIEEQNEKLKQEMLGKLKDLGNMFLKPFGLSTDNFQLKQDPNTGSYSVNMSK